MTSSSSSSPEMQPAPTADTTERFTYKHATHEEVLEDLSSRFLLNLPEEELSSLERICFQVEQAHWFYEDFVREQNPKFPSLPLKKFSAMLFHACPLLHQWSHDHEQAFNTFMQYKTRVPVCGAIMLNESWEKCILVKGWKSSSGWGFPKGKINEHEPPHECAIREVLEETGYNLAGKINPADVIEMSIKEQLISLFIVPGIPDDFPFKTRTRKEISRIEWFKLTDLPTWKRNKASPGKFYLISPFIAVWDSALKAFVTARKPSGLGARNIKATPEAAIESSPQESGSSSVDNGEPHTPSSQSSEGALASNKLSIAAHPSDDDSLSQPVDPHVARLLTSLSLSAKKTDLKPASTVPDIRRSVEISPRLAHNGTPPATHLRHTSAKFVEATHRFQHSETTLSVHANDPPFSKQGILQDTRTSSAAVAPATSSLLSYGASNESSSVVLPTSSAPPLAPLQAGATKQLPSSRRSSSIADISPYLTTPTEVPTSGKRLKQLALLELVADESSKMTPTLVSHIPGRVLLSRLQLPMNPWVNASSSMTPLAGYLGHFFHTLGETKHLHLSTNFNIPYYQILSTLDRSPVTLTAATRRMHPVFKHIELCIRANFLLCQLIILHLDGPSGALPNFPCPNILTLYLQWLTRRNTPRQRLTCSQPVVHLVFHGRRWRCKLRFLRSLVHHHLVAPSCCPS
ncbi:Dcp2, box A domain-containing protein [Pisolithus orientalis]|uniref:Dcp2, box A domain-containing protein n=1 Tax=Pisolithus orientalis TaxID=936130 RepID=UPI002224A467|nr:Dcp2, box A domain-containing protein [Pisolithus orientalis]KAI6008195.1 Dcp2, box A domain-containing protein [Pisolithus orientalis]